MIANPLGLLKRPIKENRSPKNQTNHPAIGI